MHRPLSALFLVGFVAVFGGSARAQGGPQTPARLAAQAEAMKPLSWMDGLWRGQAWTMTQTGRHEIVQTERIGPFVGGTLKVLEGRGYEADGSVSFNAFGTVAFDPDAKTYSMHSYAQGYAGDFPFAVTPTGYVWSTPAGEGRTLRYTATIKDGLWREIGELIGPGGAAPVQTFEMNLRRLGDTGWPTAGAVAKQ